MFYGYLKNKNLKEIIYKMINRLIFSINFSSEKIIKDWTLSYKDLIEILKYRKKYRPFISIQICSIRLYGSFINNVNDLAPDIISYINNQSKTPPSITMEMLLFATVSVRVDVNSPTVVFTNPFFLGSIISISFTVIFHMGDISVSSKISNTLFCGAFISTFRSMWTIYVSPLDLHK